MIRTVYFLKYTNIVGQHTRLPFNALHGGGHKENPVYCINDARAYSTINVAKAQKIALSKKEIDVVVLKGAIGIQGWRK